MSSTDTISSSLNQSAMPLTSSSLLKNVTRFEYLQNKTSSKNGAEMGKSDFLTLFTAQLKNQDPLDPVKNEAFVAQLAQFSQLEASTNMQNSMTQLADSMSGERLLSSAALIGKRVAVADAPAQLQNGQNVGASINLSGDASGVEGCEGIRKSVTFDLAAKPFIVQFTGVSPHAIGMVMTPVNP
mgnify:CR=1 FL=1